MVTPEECSREVLDTIPLIMRTIRSEVRQHARDLSVPQFRALAFLHHHPGASLSQVADFVGLTLPSMSKLVDGLMNRKLIARATCPEDRRRANLALTPAGRAVLAAARKFAQARLAGMFDPLSADERTAVVSAMRALREVFAGRGTA